MKQKNLSRWLKCILFGVGICGLIIYGIILPMYSDSLLASYPEFANRFWPWMGFLWITAIPCFAVLVLAWRIATNIGRDRSFSNENASLLKWISVLAAVYAAFFFLGNVVMLLLNMSHPSVVLASFIIVFADIAVAVISAVLSHLVKKAAILQEESDLTI